MLLFRPWRRENKQWNDWKQKHHVLMNWRTIERTLYRYNAIKNTRIGERIIISTKVKRFPRSSNSSLVLHWKTMPSLTEGNVEYRIRFAREIQHPTHHPDNLFSPRRLTLIEWYRQGCFLDMRNDLDKLLSEFLWKESLTWLDQSHWQGTSAWSDFRSGEKTPNKKTTRSPAVSKADNKDTRAAFLVLWPSANSN